ncbi:anaphase-promoting complex subunit 1 [Trichonephila clavipes]|nr:anaphase-promoting complex subunit 1 [Trichonephila clavipes]
MTEDVGIVTKKKRAALRTAVTKCISQLEKELQKTEPDNIVVKELEHFEEKFECLKIVDKECEPLYTPTEIDKEIEAVEQLIKFEENKSTKQWVFGSISSISTLDAEALPDLDLIITVDSNFTLTLYTGTMKICKVHVADIFGPINDILTLSNPLPPISYTTPKRTSFIASTRPPSASSTKFGDEV